MGFAYAEGNAVEPISNRLSLRWGSNEVRQQFGEPTERGWPCPVKTYFLTEDKIQVKET